MLTNQFIKAHGDLLKGEIDNTVYEKLDVFQEVESLGKVDDGLTAVHGAHIMCYDSGLTRYYTFDDNDPSGNIILESRDITTHELISQYVSPDTSQVFIDSYERDGKLKVCLYFSSGGASTGEEPIKILIFDSVTLNLIEEVNAGSWVDHNPEISPTLRFDVDGAKLIQFSENIDYIVCYEAETIYGNPVLIRLDYRSVDENNNAWTHYFRTTKFGENESLDEGLNAIIVEDYSDPVEIKISIRTFNTYSLIDDEGFSISNELRVQFKDFDTDEFVEVNRKVYGDGGLFSRDIVLGKNNNSLIFRCIEGNKDLDILSDFYCKINLDEDMTVQWYPHEPDGTTSNRSDYTGLPPTFSKNKDILFITGTGDINRNDESNVYLHVIDAKTMGEISAHKLTDYPVDNLNYYAWATKGGATFSNNDQILITSVYGRFEDVNFVTLTVLDTLKINTDLTIGTNTRETLLLTQHAYGNGDNPESPLDTKLGNELDRKDFLTQLRHKNVFIATTQLTTSDLNGFTLKEASVQAQNNVMISRSRIDRYKDENVVLDFQTNLRNAGEKFIETEYLEEEFTKFYDGNGVLENVKMTNVKLLHDNTIMGTGLITTFITIDDLSFKAIVEFTPLTDMTINRFQVSNSLGQALQDVRFEERTLITNTLYKFEIVMKGKEVF